MAHFLVYVTDKRKRKTVVDLDLPVLDIGSRSTCGLTLQDPVAAERHCKIELDAKTGTFLVKDLGTTTGTYVNGVRVSPSAALATGDALVLGTSRLIASVESGDAGPALELELQEKAFQFQRAEYVRKTGDWIQGDRERWVESEVTFSRFPLLRKAIWGALLVALVAPLVLVSRTLRAKAFAPGPLSSGHATLFDGSSPLLAGRPDLAQEGCQACHEPLQGTPIANCYGCHESARYSHPFSDAQELHADAPNSCLECHLEHHGGDTQGTQVALSGAWQGRTVAVPVRSGTFVPTADEALCERCHPGLDFDPERQERLLASLEGQSRPTRTVKIAYDAFSHADHRAAAIDCKSCHVPMTTGGDLDAVLGQRDFEPMQFEGCMGCHGDSDLDPALRDDLASGARADWTAEAPLFPLTWHGAADDASGCQVCHAQAYAPEMRTVAREILGYLDTAGQPIERAAQDPSLLFSYTLRHHTQEFDDAMAELDPADRASDDNCARCHVDGDWIAAGEPREGRFYHALHLAETHTAEDVERLGADPAGLEQLAGSAQACDECHALIHDSGALAQPFYRSEESSCAVCHQTRPGDEASVPHLIDDPARMQQTPGTTRVAFPHDAHTNSQHESLQAGCYACHRFERGEAAFRDPVVTPESVKNCTQCHDADHANVGGGSCSKCHLPGDPVYTSRLADADWGPSKEWPALNTFHHFSAGHMAAVQADCSRCHTSVDSAGTISAVRLPVEQDRACRSCHIEEMGRFHWR